MRLPRRSLLQTLLIASILVMTTPALAARQGASSGGQGGAIGMDGKLHRIFFAQPYSNLVFVVAGTPPALIKVLTVPPHPSALVVDSVRHRLYIASDQAGMLSIYDSRTLLLVQSLSIGGHPGGLSLLDLGRQLLITDEVAGTVMQLPVAPRLGEPTQIFNVGSGMGQIALLAPQRQAVGQRTGVWARGFLPGEPVEVSWGVQPLAMLHASSAGAVTGDFTVPLHQALGLHLVVLSGQRSARARSAILSVVVFPKPKVLRKHLAPPKSGFVQMIKQLLKPHLTLTVPSAIARGPLKKLLSHTSVPSIPAMAFETVVALICIVLLVRSRRKRRARARAARANKQIMRQQARAARAKKIP